MNNRKKELRGWIKSLAMKSAAPLSKVRPMSSGEVSAESLRDYQRLIASLAEQVSRSFDGHEIITSIVKHPDANAWAFRDAFGDDRTSVVLVTNKLIGRMQSVSTGTSAAAYQCLNSPQCPEEFKKMWGDIPKDKPHADAYGRLMAHVAMILLLNHEFAHIVIGHKFGGATCAEAGCDENHAAMDGQCCEAASPGVYWWYMAKSSNNYRSQSLEMDADSHAVLWTKVYLDRFNNNAPSLSEIGPEDKLVMTAMMGDVYTKRFVLLVASWALFLVLGGGQLDVSKFAEGTHPQVGMRLSLMTYAEQLLEAKRSGDATMVFGAAGFGALVGSNSLVGRPSVHQIYDYVGFKPALENWKSVIDHVGDLAKVRREQERQLKNRWITGALYKKVNWWGDANEGDQEAVAEGG